MKINFVSIDGGIIACGFRKMASLVRSINPETEINYIVPTNHMSVASFLLGRCTSDLAFKDIDSISRHLANADLVGFSSMTPYAELTKNIIKRVKEINPHIYLIWGGIHPIVNPEDAVNHVDAICVGEGEMAFKEFYSLYKDGLDYTGTKNFWFNQNGKIIKNGFSTLQTKEDMDTLPLPLYAQDPEFIYKKDLGFVPMDSLEYRNLNGVSYHTVWSIGCPYKCAYCSNSKFIENDPSYRRVRYSSVNHVINEIKEVKRKYPFISSVTFHDDSFIGLPMEVLEEFTEEWKKEINISFSVVGALPSLVKREKLRILIKAGMYRIKMGIQSGSDRILKFYKRPTTVEITSKAIAIINEFSPYMIPPTYDIILDNPIETREDVIDTLRFIYDMPRPYNLNVFSLRIMPNTELEKQLKEMNISHPGINDKNYTLVKPSLANILIFTIDILKPPRAIFEYLLKFAKPYGEKQPEFPGILFIVRSIYLLKRGFNHLRFLEFSYFPGMMGKFGYLLVKIGVIRSWHRRVLKKAVAIDLGEPKIEAVLV